MSEELFPCRSPYCECNEGACTHPGYFDARDIPKEYTVDEMMHHMKNPKNKLRSLADLDDVVDEIIERNPEWFAELEKLIEESLNDDSKT
jgi:hypothetical protein